MRLLDSETLEFKEFFQEDSTPSYAILSHTWEDNEVTFKDMLENRPRAELKAGFKKIRWCAKQACADKIRYIWVDTCCIDKSSSAELSEAINSMFRWYRNSWFCYVYLSDVSIKPERLRRRDSNHPKPDPVPESEEQIPHFMKDESLEEIEDHIIDFSDAESDSDDEEQEELEMLAALTDFEAVDSEGEPEFTPNDLYWKEQSLPVFFAGKLNRLGRRLIMARWFGRGWTLQELIAPRRVVFYTMEWVRIGSKNTDALVTLIEDCTGIPKRVLSHGNFSDYSIAQRMSWAASRVTTRVEDAAYCLMGLFEIHMPMLYGEGKRAFIRLQEEIIKQSNDMSIFFWTDLNGKYASYRGLLAREPSEFARCGGITWDPLETSPGPEITSLGIKLIDICLLPHPSPRSGSPSDFLVVFPGVRENKSGSELGIFLQNISQKQFVRVDYSEIHSCEEGPMNPEDSQLSTIFVRQRPILTDMSVSRLGAIHVDHWNLGVLGRCDVTSSGDSGQEQIRFLFNNYEFPKGDLVKPLLHFSILSSDEHVAFELDTRKGLRDCLSVDNFWWLGIHRIPNKDHDEFSVIRFELVKRPASNRMDSDKPILWIKLRHEFINNEFILNVKLNRCL